MLQNNPLKCNYTKHPSEFQAKINNETTEPAESRSIAERSGSSIQSQINWGIDELPIRRIAGFDPGRRPDNLRREGVSNYEYEFDSGLNTIERLCNRTVEQIAKFV